MRVILKLVTLLFFVVALNSARAQDDEFEPVTSSATPTSTLAPTATPAESQSPNTASSPVSVAENNHNEHHSHESLPTLSWLNLALSVVGVVLLFTRKLRARPAALLISVSLLGFYAGVCPCAVGASTKIVFDFLNHNSLLISGSLLAISLIPTLIFGRSFCGFACPIGALQEFLAPRAHAIRVPFRVEAGLRFGQMIFFAFLVLASVKTGSYFFEKIDPFRTIFNVRGNALQLSIAAFFLFLSLFIYRPFCRYLCPLAFLLSLVGRLSLFRIHKPTGCTNCGLCQKRCPISVIDAMNQVKDHHCIRCGECLEACKIKQDRYTFSLRRTGSEK
jgi:polyferredoxin